MGKLSVQLMSACSLIVMYNNNNNINTNKNNVNNKNSVFVKNNVC